MFIWSAELERFLLFLVAIRMPRNPYVSNEVSYDLSNNCRCPVMESKFDALVEGNNRSLESNLNTVCVSNDQFGLF